VFFLDRVKTFVFKPFINALGKCALCFTSQPGPGTAREKFDEIKSPIWTYFVKQSFFSFDRYKQSFFYIYKLENCKNTDQVEAAAMEQPSQLLI